MANEHYAGIGPRDITSEVSHNLEVVAKGLRKRGFVLRSGGATGSDTAFERGSKGRNFIFRPRDATEAAIALAKEHHPAWDACSEYVRMLHGRNAQIILGAMLDDPVKFVVTHTDHPNHGGTSLGLRIANTYEIPVFNLWIIGDMGKLKDFAVLDA